MCDGNLKTVRKTAHIKRTQRSFITKSELLSSSRMATWIFRSVSMSMADVAPRRRSGRAPSQSIASDHGRNWRLRPKPSYRVRSLAWIPSPLVDALWE
ncbi:hypothetical protein B0H12DRAFT_6520 [Mycena haematopus]|nr:hypothetical protein B0H12DRAFT_6520 [Mycena haematopus]